MKFNKNDKVIVSDNTSAYKVGTYVRDADMDNYTETIPQVIVNGEEMMCFGHVIPYSEDMVKRLNKLTPSQQFELLTYLKDWGNGKKLILMRGIAGSGKSTKAKKLVGNGQIFSTDDYWCMNTEGEYRFDINNLSTAHKWNQRRSLKAIESGVPIVIIDNTNTTIKELRGYLKHIKLAAQLGYTVSIEEPETAWRFDLEELLKKGTHNVPRQAVQAMIDRYQKDVLLEDIVFTE